MRDDDSTVVSPCISSRRVTVEEVAVCGAREHVELMRRGKRRIKTSQVRRVRSSERRGRRVG